MLQFLRIRGTHFYLYIFSTQDHSLELPFVWMRAEGVSGTNLRKYFKLFAEFIELSIKICVLCAHTVRINYVQKCQQFNRLLGSLARELCFGFFAAHTDTLLNGSLTKNIFQHLIREPYTAISLIKMFLECVLCCALVDERCIWVHWWSVFP